MSTLGTLETLRYILDIGWFVFFVRFIRIEEGRKKCPIKGARQQPLLPVY